jgi:hypothetical protein
MKKIFSIIASVFIASACAKGPQEPTPQAPSQNINGTNTTKDSSWKKYWLNRPWEARYWIEATFADRETMRKYAEEYNKPNKKAFRTYLPQEIIEPTTILRIPNEKNDLNVTVIAFNTSGDVTSANSSKNKLTGKFAQIISDSLMLSTGDTATDRQYDLGSWFHGFGDKSTDWAPTLCRTDETPSPPSTDTDQFYKYGRAFKATPYSETFGCREWGFQLYDNSRPYIDITSYVPKSKKLPHGNYIRSFIGWARFGDNKPVIGKHGETWVCLHDCPKGSPPGIIKDIAAWAKENGWEAPKRPKKMPQFPDPKIKASLDEEE